VVLALVFFFWGGVCDGRVECILGFLFANRALSFSAEVVFFIFYLFIFLFFSQQQKHLNRNQNKKPPPQR
jgi:hypothetical protein